MLDYTPRPYQRLIEAHILLHKRCIVNAQMGLGKTVSTLTALDRLAFAGYDDVWPALVPAPERVARSVWPAEVLKWAHLSHLRVSAVLGTPDERLAALRTPADVYTINYENLEWLYEILKATKTPWPFKTVIADEATRLKNFRLKQGGKRARVLGKADVAHSGVQRWINLTGTMTPNGLIDLWGQVWFIDGGRRLGRTMDAFRQRWFRPAFNGYGVDPLPHAEHEIGELLSDICISLKTADWLPVAEPTFIDVMVDLPAKARRIYDEMERAMYTELLSTPLEVFNAAAKSIKCLQIAAGAAYMDKRATQWEKVHNAKLEALESLINESDGPLLVAYHWRTDLERLQQAFPQARLLDKRQSTIDEWNAGKIPILLAYPGSCGHGLNLQDGGHIAVYFSSWWNQEEDAQMHERIGPARQYQAGHPRPVLVYRLVARDTVDEDVLTCLSRKMRVSDALMERLKAKYG